MNCVSACSVRKRRPRKLRSSRWASIGPLGALNRPKENFNLELVRIASLKLHDLIKPVVSNQVL